MRDSRCRGRGDPQPVRRRPAVSRKLRRVRRARYRSSGRRSSTKSRPFIRKTRPNIRWPSPIFRSRAKVPDFADRLPRSIRKFTKKGVYDTEETQHLSFTQGGGHGGSHPHLAHEFLMSIVEERPPARRRHQRQLDDDRHLAPMIGHEGGRAGGNSAVLTRQPDEV